MARWIDVSIRLRHGLVPWPGDAPFELKRVSDLAHGDGVVAAFSSHRACRRERALTPHDSIADGASPSHLT